MTSPVGIKTLAQAFALRHGEVISLVGAGGKTTLMFALARELVASGNFVITTTTTKIMAPLPHQTPLLLIEKNEERLLRLLPERISKYHHITLASERLPRDKLKGISPELILRLGELEQKPDIIVEADGASHRSLKAPNATEPVMPPNTSLVIPVVGIDILGCLLNEDNVFRSRIAARLLCLPIGNIITAEDIATLLTHDKGIIKGSPKNARIIPFINKVKPADLECVRYLAENILRRKDPRIKRVILGNAQSLEAGLGIIKEK